VIETTEKFYFFWFITRWHVNIIAKNFRLRLTADKPKFWTFANRSNSINLENKILH